ncbi:FkbM family methyltransferase [Nostoc sp.]
MKKLIKNIYYSKYTNYFRKYICLSLRHIYSPPRRFWRLLCFDGNFSVKLDEDNEFLLNHTGRWIESSLFWHSISDYEPISLDIWQKACKYSNLIIDIGANSGLYSLIAKSVNPTSKVYAFEPLKEFDTLIKQNIELNDYDIKVINNAVSDITGLADFYVPQDNQGNIYSSTLSIKHYLQHQQSKPIVYQVNVTTLDDFVKENNLQTIDLIKIDAEGHDLNILKGFIKSLVNIQPDFLIEIQNEYIGREIQKILIPERDLYYAIDEAHEPIRTDSLEKVNCRNFWICKRETAQKLELL